MLNKREEMVITITTILHIIYDTLVKRSSKEVSLNDCLETGLNYKIFAMRYTN